MTFPCCFSRSKSPKGWFTWCKIFRLFLFLWCWYCVLSFPWASEVEIEIAVTKTSCMYTASSKVLQETSSSWVMTLWFLFFQNLGMIVGHVYTVSLYSTSMKINSFSYWDLKYYFLRSPKSAAYVIFAISFMGTLILVPVHNILPVPLPCLFSEVKLCQAGLVLG